MIYLIIGTMAQKYIGLYEATRTIFYSPIFWISYIPLPGMPIFMALLVVNLTAYVFLKNPWQKDKIGTLITHIGVILLMVAGFYTAAFSQAGYIDLALTESTDTVSDYHQRALTVRNLTTTDTMTFDHTDLAGLHQLPFKIDVLETCQNCEIIVRQNKDKTFHGMAQHMQLVGKDPDMQNEENMAGLVFEVSGTDQDGVYLVLEGVPQYPEISFNGDAYRFELNKATRSIPFKIQLIDFRRQSHPGISMAKAYESDVLIKDGDIQWQTTVKMNEPLRYKGYTLFQSSFIETPAGDRSVFSVVQNSGRAFPYIAGFAICLGLILHLMIVKLPKIKQKDPN